MQPVNSLHVLCRRQNPTWNAGACCAYEMKNTALLFAPPLATRTRTRLLSCENVHFMRYPWFATALIIFSVSPALTNPAVQNPTFHTSANLSVDNAAMTLSSAVAIRESRKYPAGYSWVRIHFYSFPLTSDDIAAARSGNVESLDRKANKNSFDPKIRNGSFGVVQLSVDKEFKVWQVDMSIPGHACTIAPFEKDVHSFLQTYHYDGKNLTLKSKGSYVCDLKAMGAGDQTYKWDIDVALPVFEKASPRT